MNRFDIKDKQDFLDRIDKIKQAGILASEMFIDSMFDLYIFGQNKIPNTSREEIYIECIEMLCDLIRQGAIHSKWLLANQMINQQRYIYHDKILTKFLIELSAFENQSNACDYMADKYLDFNDVDIANFWKNKSQIGWSKQITGTKLNLYFMRKEESQENIAYIYFKN